MTPENDTVNDIELQAFVDNELDSSRHAEIEKLIQTDARLKSKVEEYQKINRDLKQLYQPHLDEDIPDRLIKTIKRDSAPKQIPLAASLLIGVLTGLIIGWFSRGEIQSLQTPPPVAEQIVEDAFSFHAVYTPEVKHPVEVTSEYEEHLVSWLSKRLETPVKAPDFSFAGFELLGGRLLSSGNSPAAQFMYENNQGQRLTIFTRQKRNNEDQPEFRYARRNGMNGFYWTDSNLSFVILSEISKNRIYELVTKVCNTTNLK